jgi:hypothetical protein
MPDPRSRAEGTSREETRDAGRPNPRPRFTLKSKLAPTEIRKRVNAMIQSSPRVRGIAFDHRIEIAIDGDEHHFWSPQLVIDVKAEEGGAELEARFGPDPYVWALYLLSYGGLLVLTFFASMFGIASSSSTRPPPRSSSPRSPACSQGWCMARRSSARASAVSRCTFSARASPRSSKRTASPKAPRADLISL